MALESIASMVRGVGGGRRGSHVLGVGRLGRSWVLSAGGEQPKSSWNLRASIPWQDPIGFQGVATAGGSSDASMQARLHMLIASVQGHVTMY